VIGLSSGLYNVAAGNGSGVAQLANGMRVRRYQVNATQQAKNQSDRYAPLLQQRFSEDKGIGLIHRPFRRFEYEVTLYKNDPGFGDWRVEVGWADSTNDMTGAFFPASGLKFVAVTTLNGGRWTPVIRRQTGGILVAGGDTGLTVFDAHRLKFIYTEGLIPTLEAQLDGVTRFSTAGDLNMMQFGALVGSFTQFNPGISLVEFGGLAAHELYTWDSVVRIGPAA
jgi:hypothetical protein